jgi:hypothetical protein
MKALMILFLITSLCTKSLAVEGVIIHDLIDRKLTAGQRAPYAGILVTDDHYRQLSSCLGTLPACEASLQESIKSGISFGDFALVFGAGALFGALVLAVAQNGH